MDVQRLSDELEITALLHMYARAVDTKDWDPYRTVFTDDAVIDYSSAGIPAGSHDEIAVMFSEAFTAIPWTMHYITNIEPDIDGDTAHVRAMFYNPMQLPGMREQSSCGGYYVHDLVRTPTAGAAVTCARTTCGSSTALAATTHPVEDWLRAPQSSCCSLFRSPKDDMSLEDSIAHHVRMAEA